MLKIDKLNAAYGQYQVIYDISIEIDSGAILAIYGANGHGKSTLLKTICGIVPSISGTITFDGRRIEKLSPKKIVEYGIVYIPEDRHLFPQMCVLENLKLGAYNPRARKKLSDNLEYVFYLFPRLKERLNQQVQTMSGGEARMLTIGRGLMSDASFLAIDEPSIGLSPLLRKEIFNKISEINKKGISIILVEQNVTETEGLAHKVCLLEDGRLVLEGTETEVFGNSHFRSVLLGL